MAKKINKPTEMVPVSEDLPDEYVPKELRPTQPEKRKQVDYVCAYETVWRGDKPRSEYAVWAGPFMMLDVALNKVPAKDSIVQAAQRGNSVIIRFNLDGTEEVLYRWKESRSDPGRWIREKK